MLEDDYDLNLKSKKLFKDTCKTLKNGANNLYEKLTSLGYEYCDEGGDGKDSDIIEEQNSEVKNANQRQLVLYFMGQIELNQAVLSKFLSEKRQKNPNYPLFRKYFRSGNLELKELLLFGLKSDPTNVELLSDLNFFNEFNQILNEVIRAHIKACKLQSDRKKFNELAEMFYFATKPYEYDSFEVLNKLFDKDVKKIWLDRLKANIESNLAAPIIPL